MASSVVLHVLVAPTFVRVCSLLHPSYFVGVLEKMGVDSFVGGGFYGLCDCRPPFASVSKDKRYRVDGGCLDTTSVLMRFRSPSLEKYRLSFGRDTLEALVLSASVGWEGT